MTTKIELNIEKEDKEREYNFTVIGYGIRYSLRLWHLIILIG